MLKDYNMRINLSGPKSDLNSPVDIDSSFGPFCTDKNNIY